MLSVLMAGLFIYAVTISGVLVSDRRSAERLEGVFILLATYAICAVAGAGILHIGSLWTGSVIGG